MNVTINVELSTSVRRDGTQQLMLRITENRQHKRVKIDWSIKKRDWNQKEQQVRKTDPRYRQINEAIRLKKLEVEEQILQNYRDREPVTSEQIVRKLKGEAAGPSTDFFTYAAGYIERQHRYGTQKRYRSAVNKIRLFSPELTFEQITPAWIRDYEAHMRKLGNKPNTIAVNVQVLRTIIYDAIRMEVVDQARNPFFRHSIKYVPAERAKLSEADIAAIEALELPANKPLWHARNFFLFSFYQAGMRTGDALFARIGDFEQGRNKFNMQKTAKRVSLKLVDQAVAILDLYRVDPKTVDPATGLGLAKGPEDYVFPYVGKKIESYRRRKGTEPDQKKLLQIKASSNEQINKFLRVIRQMAGITKHVTMHVARHSFSEIAMEKGISIYDLSKLLQHSSVKVTENYLSNNASKTLDQSLENVYKKKTS